MSTARNFKSIAAAEPTDHDIDAFAKSRGVPVMRPLEPTAVAQPQPLAAAKTAPMADVPGAPTTRVGVDIPQYLAHDLKIRAVTDNCSTRFLILKALQSAGFTVHEQDLIADGRRAR